MAKVVGVFELEPKAGVAPEAFERFLVEEMSQAPLLPGQQAHFFKSDRGERNGKYAAHFQFESVAVRDRYWPKPDENSPELDRWWAEHGASWDRLFAMADATWTDYVELGR